MFSKFTRPAPRRPFPLSHPTSSSFTGKMDARHGLTEGPVVSHKGKSIKRHQHAPPPRPHAVASIPKPSEYYDTSLPIALKKYFRSYGLTPPVPESQDTQAHRCLAQLSLKSNDLERFVYLSNLRHNNVHLFYRLLTDHFTEITPLVYTPTVGEACQKWCEIYQHAEGMYLSFEDKGHIANIIQNWPQQHVEITVVTDGSRILGLGDLGIGGMGIPIGKLALYTGCAGIRPEGTLPLTIDFGTGNKQLLKHPLYMGHRVEKISDEEQIEFLDELMEALKERWPDIVIQFEDWKNPFPTLERYRHTYAMFNDDIQGTGAVIMGGIIGAVRESGVAPKDHRAVFLGSGSAGVGVAKQIVEYFMREGMKEEDARKCFWLVDSKGLVTSDRGDELADHKLYFSRHDNDGKQYHNLAEVVEYVKPTMLLGLSTIGGAFTTSILQKMGEWNKRPIVFPLSNPSSKSECTFEDAVTHTDGRVLFASGSPFHAYTYKGKTYHPGQGNNMYVFPGIGLGTILCKAVEVTSEMIYASGEAVPSMITEEEKDMALLYPDITRIRDVSARVALYVIRAAQKCNVDKVQFLRELDDKELEAWIQERMYNPHLEGEGMEKDLLDIAQALKGTKL